MTLVTKAEAERRKLIDKAKADLAAQEQPAAAPVASAKGTKSAKKPALTIVPAAPAGVPAGEKFCKRHNTTHPLDQFANDRSSRDGKYSICKQAEADDRAAKKARLAASGLPVAAMPQAATPAPKAKKVSRKK